MSAGMNEIVWRDADPDAVADHLARVLARAQAIVAMPGGKTPVPILEALARRDVAGIVWLVDDRIVPHDHPASNHGLLARALAGTGLVLAELKEGASVPRFDLVWLGMGADGHVASIFPNALDELTHGRNVMRTRPDPLPPEAPFDRLTLTIEALADTAEAILVITGRDKRHVLEQALEGASDLPISRVMTTLSATLTVYWSEQ